MNQTIVVIGGGQNVEHDVSLASADAVAASLRRSRYQVEQLAIERTGIWTHCLKPLGDTVIASLAGALRIVGEAHAVFPAVHGPLGEDGSLAALCALAMVPMVGSDLHAGAVGMDKQLTKLVARAEGLPTAAGRVVRISDIDELQITGPVVVKPVRAGSSYGVSLATNHREFAVGLRSAAAIGDQVLVEPYVRGREIDIAILRKADDTLIVAPPLEIHTSGLFDTAAKYDGTTRFTVPAELTDSDRHELTHSATVMFNALGCRGVARVDFFVTADGLVLNEVNTVPGFTPASQVPRMFEAAGIPYDELVSLLVMSARVPVAGVTPS
ncbi:D-alanine--D-alanine ligase [Microlunatus sp. GCM10028923]|uniref:D-alanine--D-alanine ligase family protein n=1 Tax=Microlunatus sp. GCM10028923 TaxID=3273400 RepID=UPI003621F14F